MKILMTSDTIGGVWTYSLELARALEPHGVQVILAAKGILQDDQRAEALSIPSVTLFNEDFQLEWMDKPWDDLAAASAWLHGIADETQPDVIHLNEYCHGSSDWKSPVLIVGHSCVLSWHAAVRNRPAGTEWEIYADRVRAGLRAADVVVAPTTHMLNELERFYGPLPRKQAILNGCYPRTAAGEKQPFVFSAGRLWDEAKNIATLAKAAEHVVWPVHVAGLPHPQRPAGEVEGVHWLGRLSREQMQETYGRAAIYALPAVYEPFGLTALEAAQAGCALVLSDIPTLREIWGDAAHFVPPRDATAWAEALNHLAADAAAREQLAAQALQRGQELTAAACGQAYFNLYQQLAATPRAPSKV